MQTINPLSEVDQNDDATSYFGFADDRNSPADAEPSRSSDSNQGHKTETIEFEHYWQMYTFINGMFQLKPYMLTRFSMDNFRIVVEIT